MGPASHGRRTSLWRGGKRKLRLLAYMEPTVRYRERWEIDAVTQFVQQITGLVPEKAADERGEFVEIGPAFRLRCLSAAEDAANKETES